MLALLLHEGEGIGMGFDPYTGQPVQPQAPPKKGGTSILKIILGVFIAGLLLTVGCVVVIGLGANSAINSASSSDAAATAHYNASAARFRKAFRRVKVGDTLTGAGGATIHQVVALLGKPDKGDVTVTTAGGDKLVTYDYHFFQATGSPSWVISFTNGRVTDKTSM
jgi:hypothetical protein